MANINWKHVGRVATRVLGAGVGAAIGTLGGPAGIVAGAGLGYEAGSIVGDASMKDEPKRVVSKNYAPFNPMDSYNAYAKPVAPTKTSSLVETGQGFDQAIGLVDTGVKTVGAVLSKIDFDGGTSEVGSVDKGFHLGKGKNMGKIVPGKTAWSKNSAFDLSQTTNKNTSLLNGVGSFINLASNGQYKGLQTKIKAMDEMYNYNNLPNI